MRLEYANSANALLFEQYLILPKSTPILLQEDASSTIRPHLLIQSESPHHIELATPNDPNIAGGAYITDADHNAIATLSSDGNISTFVP